VDIYISLPPIAGEADLKSLVKLRSTLDKKGKRMEQVFFVRNDFDVIQSGPAGQEAGGRWFLGNKTKNGEGERRTTNADEAMPAGVPALEAKALQLCLDPDGRADLV
jgi:hypothetical protein